MVGRVMDIVLGDSCLRRATGPSAVQGLGVVSGESCEGQDSPLSTNSSPWPCSQSPLVRGS